MPTALFSGRTVEDKNEALTNSVKIPTLTNGLSIYAHA